MRNTSVTRSRRSQKRHKTSARSAHRAMSSLFNLLSSLARPTASAPTAQIPGNQALALRRSCRPRAARRERPSAASRHWYVRDALPLSQLAVQPTSFELNTSTSLHCGLTQARPFRRRSSQGHLRFGSQLATRAVEGCPQQMKQPCARIISWGESVEFSRSSSFPRRGKPVCTALLRLSCAPVCRFGSDPHRTMLTTL